MNQSILSNIELKVIPPVQFLIALIAMLGFSHLFPRLAIDIFMHKQLCIFMLTLAGILGGVSVYSFKRKGTTVDPSKPENTSVFIVSGAFRLSRNPMYLGLCFILLSAFFYLQNLGALIAIVCFVLFITRFQIIPEERALTAHFGDEYKNYQQRVRRWL